jgi:foldase protein PrsA
MNQERSILDGINRILKILFYLEIKIFLFVLLFLSCAEKEQEIVAEFGDQQITLDEFRIAYLDVIKKPNAFDSPELREQFLDELITSRVLAGEAEKRGYGENEKLRYKAEAYKNKALREAHFEKVIRPKFSISEEDIQEAYIYSQEERKVSHLFAESRQEMDSLHLLLQKGKTFAQIAPGVFENSTLAENGGDLGWINWEDLEYDLAMTAFRLPIDTFSAPVESRFGYHILKVTDYKKKPLITRQEYEMYKNKAKTKLEYMLGDKYARKYINTLFDVADIKIYPEIITAVRSKLKGIFQRPPDQFNQMNEMQLTATEVRLVERSLWDMRNEPFASINGKDYTVGDFMGTLNFIPYNIIFNSFKTSMDYAFRDFLITEEAREMGLEKSKNVENKSGLYREYLLQRELRQDLRENEEAIPRFVEKILNGKSIKKHPEVIHAYYDSILNQ